MKKLRILKSKFTFRSEKMQLALYLIGFGIVGGLVVIFSHAATSSSSIDPENGSTNGAVARFSDPNASGGQAVKFGATGGTISTACKYSTSVTPAFCETFDTPYSGVKTQTGDLDPTLWGVSRVSDFNPGQGKINAITPSHNACSGGGATDVGNPVPDEQVGDPTSHYFGPATPPPADARICNGQYVESNNDGGSIANIDTYPKQPFNFAGRTGTVVFDVSADRANGHGSWPEFLITDEPVPGVLRCISECNLREFGTIAAQNQIGFSLDGSDCGGHPLDKHYYSGVGVIYMTKSGAYQDSSQAPGPDLTNFTNYDNCIIKGSLPTQTTPGVMNHFEVKISQTRIDIYGTDGGSTVLKHMAGADLSLGFSQGLVWMNDAHYNSRKSAEPCQCGTGYDHSFAWDNLGFDGPKTYRDLGYDVPLADQHTNTMNTEGEFTGVQEGYAVQTSRTFTIPNVSWFQEPANVKAKVVLNGTVGGSNANLTAVLNGKTNHAVTKQLHQYHTSAVSFDFPIADANRGTNTLTFTTDDGSTALSNISLIIVAGAPVP